MNSYGIVWNVNNNYYFLIKDSSGDIWVIPHIGSDIKVIYIEKDYKIKIIFDWKGK